MMEKILSNFRSLEKIFFEQVTEFGSFMFYAVVSVVFIFFNLGLAARLMASLALIMVLALAIKAAYRKNRPLAQNKRNIVEKIDSGSFPSIHSMRITALFFWLSVFFYPNLLLILFLGAVSACVLYSRIYLKKHFISDVAFGVVFSALICLLLFLFL